MRPDPIPFHDRLLHWLLATLVISMLVLGKVVDEMDQRGAFDVLRNLHMNVGFLVLLLGSHRLWRRVAIGFPNPIHSLSRFQRRTSRIVQWTLLLSTVLMPLSGVAMAVARRVPINLLGVFELPRLAERAGNVGSAASTLHELTAILILLCLFIHIGAALKHHLIDRDEVLRRMLGR